MPKEEMKLINLRVPVSMYEEYKKFCISNDTNISSALRENMRHDLGLSDAVKTSVESDFRDRIPGNLHGNFPAMW